LGELKMAYNMTGRPKIIRTQLDEEAHMQFKMLCAKRKITMTHMMEKLILHQIKKECKENGVSN
jgi:hypothetical protein